MNDINESSMKYTLEEHLHYLGQKNKEVAELCALWSILEKDLTDKLSQSSRVFPYYSKHDVTHSKSIITNIGLFLGEARIKKLSPTDTFLLILCAHVHDYGMAYSIEEVCEILNDSNGQLREYIQNKREYSKEAKVLYDYYHKNKYINFENVAYTLRDIYLAITIVLSDFLRPQHSEGVKKMEKDFKALLYGRIKQRFISAVIVICKLHGEDFENIFKELEYCCTGIFSDDCHPRFIAAMIRIGDLLDLDNSRFSNEFERSYFSDSNSIPELSRIHYLKHESITHLYINHESIEVEANIYTKTANELSRKVAVEIYKWLNGLDEECQKLNTCWSEIAQYDYGTPPRVTMKKVFIDGIEYLKQLHDLKMELPNDRIFSLLNGTNIYKNKYVAFREVIQNAIDATLLQVWKDFVSGEIKRSNTKDYNSLLRNFLGNSTEDKRAKELIKKNNTPLDFFINKYSIQVNVIADKGADAVYIEVIDNGTGIGEEDLVYMSKIGGNHMSNPQINKLVKDMPPWLTPSGAFGIGLQSLFQLTNQIDFFTKKSNRTPRHIIFYSYSYNKGCIECLRCPSELGETNDMHLFNKIASHGTMVRFRIDNELFCKENYLLNYDEEKKKKNNFFKHIWVEVLHQLKQYFNNIEWDYFPVYLNSYNIEKKDSITHNVSQCVYPNRILYSTLKSKNKIIFDFMKKSRYTSAIVCYYNTKHNLFFVFIIPTVTITYSNQEKVVVKIHQQEDFFRLQYKHEPIENYTHIFRYDNMADSPYILMLKQNVNLYNLKVEIFDSDASKYLSIDRNVLKRNSLTFDVIKESEQNCFTKLCEELTLQNTRIKDDCFPILTLLFARFVNKNMFNAFFDKYSNKHKYYIKIGKNDYDILTIKDNFAIELIYDENYEITDDEFYKNVFSIFPQNFFCPSKIIYSVSDEKDESGEKQIRKSAEYLCKIRRDTEKECLIKMDSYSKEQEIFYSLTSYNTQKLNIKLLIKSLFKPWKDYKDIVVYKHPITFKYKNHCLNNLEKNIYNFILSPFDDNVTDFMLSLLNDGKQKFIDKTVELIVKSSQFTKCIEYVEKYGIKSNAKDVIQDKYIQFVKTVLNYIWDLYQVEKSKEN